MSTGDIIILVVGIIAAVFAGLYFLNRWAYKKMDTQQTLIDKSKQTATIFVIDKKKDKITNVNMPKVVIENMPKIYKYMKMRFVQAKIGPQIMTLMCDKRIFEAIPVKKNVKVELAGIYIVNVIGMKSAEELKQMKKEKKLKEKEAKKSKKTDSK